MKFSAFGLLVACLLGVVAHGESKEALREKIFTSASSCDKAVYTDENYLIFSLPPGAQGLGYLQVNSLVKTDEVLNLPAADQVEDVKVRDGILYILTGSTLEAWNLADKKQLFTYKTHPRAHKGANWRHKATGFILNEGLAVVSHGSVGISVIDLSNGGFVKLLPMPTVSAAQDIALLNSNVAILAIDNDDQAMFSGFYVMDLKALSIIRTIKVDNVFPSAVRVLDNNRLMMIYFNAVWRFNLTQTLNSKQAQPVSRAFRFPGLGVVDMVGKVAFDKKNLYSCFKDMDEKGRRTIKPLVFNLESLQLN